MINSPDEMMQYVVDVAMRAVKNSFSNEKLNAENLVTERLDELVYLVTGLHAEKDSIKIEISDANAIIPKNLYTLLLLNGVVVEYEKVKNEKEFITQCGTHFVID